METGTEGGKAELVHYFCHSRSSRLSLVGEGASTKEVKQRVGQNICHYFFLYCQETDYNHSSA